MGQLHGGEGHLHDVEFVGQRLDHDPEVVEVAGEDRLAQGGPRDLQPPGAKIGHCRQPGHLDLLPRGPLDPLQLAVLARLGQRDRDPFPSRPTHAADPVHVRFRLAGDVVIDDVREVFDVQPPRRDVGGDQQVDPAGPELLHHAAPLLLGHAAVQPLGAVTSAAEALGQLVHLGASPAEDDRR